MSAVVAAKLKADGQQLEFIWDEGGIISAQGVPPFTHMPVALVATAEKYYQVRCQPCMGGFNPPKCSAAICSDLLKANNAYVDDSSRLHAQMSHHPHA